jgi:predicted transcriptional regulator
LDRIGPWDDLAVSIEPIADGVDARLDQIADDRQSANHVAVKRAVAHRHLGLVAGGEHQGAKFVGERHQERAANARLNVFLGDVFLHAGKSGIESLGELREERFDGDGFKANAEIGGQLLRLSSMEPAEE